MSFSLSTLIYLLVSCEGFPRTFNEYLNFPCGLVRIYSSPAPFFPDTERAFSSHTTFFNSSRTQSKVCSCYQKYSSHIVHCLSSECLSISGAQSSMISDLTVDVKAFCPVRSRDTVCDPRITFAGCNC